MSLELEEQYDKIYKYCYFKVKNKSAAEDLTQETFLKYFMQTSYLEKGKLMAYLYTIAKNQCTDYFRRRELLEVDDGIAASDQISENETHYVLQNALAKLPKEEQELVFLRFVNELSMSEIAGMMNISRFALHRKLKKILDELKKTLRREDFYE